MRVTTLAIECHPHVVRLVRLSRRYGQVSLDGFAQAALPPDATPAALAGLARQLVADHSLAADRIVLGLSGAAAVLRRLRFPFSSRQKIAMVLGPAIEPHLTVPLDDTALAWTMTVLEAPPGTIVLAAAYPRAKLLEFVEAFRQHGLAPLAVGLDLAGLDAVAARLPGDGATLLVSLDRGSMRCICRFAGKAASWRSVPLPDFEGPDRTAALASFLAREASLTLSPLAGQSRATSPHVVVSGLSLYPEAVATALAQATGVPLATLAQSKILPTTQEAGALPDAFAAAYGLALSGGQSLTTLNFLQGSLAPDIPKPVLRRGQILAAGAVLVLLVSLAASLSFAFHRRHETIAALQAKAAAILAEVVPNAPKSLTLAQKLSILRARVAEQTDAEAALRKGGHVRVLDILSAMDKALPRELPVQFRRIAVTDKHVAFDATADDFATVEEVKRRLTDAKVFPSVEIKGAKNVPDKKQVQFQMDLSLPGAQPPSGGGRS